jgi:hypothetical protein
VLASGHVTQPAGEAADALPLPEVVVDVLQVLGAHACVLDLAPNAPVQGRDAASGTARRRSSLCPCDRDLGEQIRPDRLQHRQRVRPERVNHHRGPAADRSGDHIPQPGRTAIGIERRTRWTCCARSATTGTASRRSPLPRTGLAGSAPGAKLTSPGDDVQHVAVQLAGAIPGPVICPGRLDGASIAATRPSRAGSISPNDAADTLPADIGAAAHRRATSRPGGMTVSAGGVDSSRSGQAGRDAAPAPSISVWPG